MSKKILHIIDNLGLWWAQIVVKWIFEWQNSNNNIFLFSLRKTKIITSINHNNLIIHNSSFKYNFPLLKLRKFIKENDIEIIHCHLAKSQIIWWILKTIFFPNIKLVFHEHWEIFEDWKIYPFFMNLFKEKINSFISVSNAIKQKLEDKTKISKEKIVVLYNFVDLNKFKKIIWFDKKIEKINYWFDKNDFLIWFAGRLIERKWWFEFLQAAKILKYKWYDFKYLIAWDWEDKNKITSFIKKYNLENEIKLIWYVENMNEFYNIIDVFILPSHWEWLAMAQLETLACWTSLISWDWPWLNEVIIDSETAMIFKSKNAFDLSWKIVEMYEEEDIRKQLIKSSLKEVKKYSLENYLEKLENIYLKKY